MILQFDVINQRIVRKDDNYIVANSQFYLQIDFNFTQDWYGFGKTITFVSGTKKFSIGLNAQDSCVVPYEVIKTPSFLFSIRGELDDVIITTNVITVPIKASGETNGIAPGEPPKEIFSGLQNGLKGQVLGKSSDDNYDYDFQNLKDLQYDDENTLGDVLEELVVDAVTDVKYEDGYLKKVENGETTNVVEMYDKEAIDNLLENLDQYIEKSDTPGLIKNDGTIDETQYASKDDLDSAKSDLQNQINDKQHTLEAGNNIQINNNTISATDTTYDAGSGLTLTGTTFSVDTTIIATKQDLSNEINAREQAITGLDNAKQDKLSQDQLNAVNSGITQAKREGYDTLQGQITDEETARGNADTRIEGKINNHIADKSNPHEVTKTQVGLGNVANTGDSATPSENGTEKFTTGGAYTLKTNLEQADTNEATTRNTNDNALASAVSDRQCLFIMENVVLNNWTDVGIPQEFENYSYVAVIRNSVIVGAQSVNVLFTITQILSDNYCPSPLIDNVEGTIKIFGNDNMTITLPRVEIFKSVEYSIPEEEE